MTRDERRLRRHLTIAVLLKLAALALLWWAFVRDAGGPVDAERAAAHLGAVTSPQGASK